VAGITVGSGGEVPREKRLLKRLNEIIMMMMMMMTII
jgi:hypothetical protein